MRTIPFSTLIGQSFLRTKIILAEPFVLKKWLKLLFIAWLAGSIGGSGNLDIGDILSPARNSQNERTVINFLPDILTLESPAYAKSTLQTHPFSQDENSEPSDKQPAFDKSWEKIKPYASIIIIAVLFFLLPLAILFTWLSARFKFIWYHSITEDSDRIAAPFKNYVKEGNSQFFFLLIMTLSGLLILAGLGFWGFYRFRPFIGYIAEGEFTSVVFPLLWAVSGPILALIIFSIAFAITYVLNEHIVIPIMAMDGSDFKEGWRRFFDIYKENTKDIWCFVLVLIGLGILSSIIAIVVLLLLLLAVLVTAAVIFGIPYLIFMLLLKAEALFGVFTFVAAIPFVTAVIILMAMTRLPFAVFFRCFSLYYLSSLECGYSPLVFSEKKTAEENNTIS